MNRSGGILCLAMLALAIGCTKPPPVIVAVSGTVTSNGQPLPFAEVRFYPQEDKLGGDYIGAAITDEKGHYTLVTKGQPGACTGVHKVTVSEAPTPKSSRGRSDAAMAAHEEYLSKLVNRPIPKQYVNVAETPLTATVTPEKSEYDFALVP